MLAIVLLLTCQLPFSLDNVGTIVATLLFSTPLTLLIIGIVQVCRRVMPSSLVAASAIMPIVILNDLHQIHHRAPDFRRIAIILTPGTRIIVLSFIFICLWGRLPHRTHAPHSAVAVSSLGVASIWQAIIALLSAWNKNNMHAVDASTGFIQIQPMVHAFPSLLTHLHEDKSSLALTSGYSIVDFSRPGGFLRCRTTRISITSQEYNRYSMPIHYPVHMRARRCHN